MYHEIHTPSGTYNFTVHPIGTQLHRLSGLYIFLIIPRHDELIEPQEAEILEAANNQQLSTINQYSLLYVGITNNFNARLKQHHKIATAIELGMTHIGILKVSSGRKRKKIEREILKHLNPPLNQTWLNYIPPSSPEACPELDSGGARGLNLGQFKT